jgi:hypothetical protein
MADRSRDQWLRLQAVQVIAMLPENEEEALRILAYAQELLQRFVADGQECSVAASPRPVTVLRPIPRPD